MALAVTSLFCHGLSHHAADSHPSSPFVAQIIFRIRWRGSSPTGRRWSSSSTSSEVRQIRGGREGGKGGVGVQDAGALRHELTCMDLKIFLSHVCRRDWWWYPNVCVCVYVRSVKGGMCKVLEICVILSQMCTGNQKCYSFLTILATQVHQSTTIRARLRSSPLHALLYNICILRSRVYTPSTSRVHYWFLISFFIEAHDALHHFSCKMLTPRHCTGSCSFKSPLLPPWTRDRNKNKETLLLKKEGGKYRRKPAGTLLKPRVNL